MDRDFLFRETQQKTCCMEYCLLWISILLFLIGIGLSFLITAVGHNIQNPNLKLDTIIIQKTAHMGILTDSNELEYGFTFNNSLFIINVPSFFKSPTIIDNLIINTKLTSSGSTDITNTVLRETTTIKGSTIAKDITSTNIVTKDITIKGSTSAKEITSTNIITEDITSTNIDSITATIGDICSNYIQVVSAAFNDLTSISILSESLATGTIDIGINGTIEEDWNLFGCKDAYEHNTIMTYNTVSNPTSFTGKLIQTYIIECKYYVQIIFPKVYFDVDEALESYISFDEPWCSEIPIETSFSFFGEKSPDYNVASYSHATHIPGCAYFNNRNTDGFGGGTVILSKNSTF